MGSRGSSSSKVSYNISDKEQEGGNWNVVSKKNGMYVYEMKNPDAPIKPPEHSKFPNRIVIMYHRSTDKTQGVKTVTHYDENGNRDFEIHTANHKGIQPHVHSCSEQTKFSPPTTLTSEQQAILDNALNY
ncbi:MAG: hypothetical protein Q4B68_07715 [Bacteroidales bacterium]|nr:hypothetical protein [Bacteroidales bacterium]